MRTLRDNQGFTLIELMIVVVIIGILAAIAIPKFSEVADGAKQAEAGPILKQICSLAEAQEMKDGQPPANLAAITGFDEAATLAGAQHFTAFAFAGGIASATAGNTGAVDATLNCATGDITP